MSVIYIDSYRFGVSGPSDPYFSNVSLLLHGDGTNGSTTIVDSSASPKTITAFGNAQISTAQSKFGGSSIAFDGNGDYLAIAGPQETAANDFTIELWAYFNTSNGSYLFDCRPSPSAPSGTYPILYADEAGGFSLKYVFSGFIKLTSNTLTLNTWHHIAVCRYQGVTRLYVNGVSNGSGYTNNDTAFLIDATSPIIGSRSSLDVYQFNGYIDELRITNGVARYTSNFTPPTAPFPNS